MLTPTLESFGFSFLWLSKQKEGSNRFILSPFSKFNVFFCFFVLTNDEALRIEDLEGAVSLDRSDILSIYSVRESFNLTLSDAEHAWRWCGWQLLVERHGGSTDDSNEALPWRAAAWCMLINRWNRGGAFLVGWEIGSRVWLRESCQTALTKISKSHKVCVTAQEPKSHVVYATKALTWKVSHLI